MNKTILITGSNSGIGKLTALHFANNNWHVIATMRTPAKAGSLAAHPNIKISPLDVTSTQSIADTRDTILKEYDKIDLVVNNAGFGVYGPFEEATEAEIDRQIAVNVKGLMMVTKAWLPHFRTNRAGMFINISSVAGLISYPLGSLYVSSKWAVEGFTEALFYELKPFNIKVKLVEPGGFKTNFQTTSITWTNDPNITDYNELSKAHRAVRDARQPHLPDAQLVAEAIFEAANDTSDRLRYLIGEDAKEATTFRQKEGVDNFLKRNYERFIKKNS